MKIKNRISPENCIYYKLETFMILCIKFRINKQKKTNKIEHKNLLFIEFNRMKNENLHIHTHTHTTKRNKQ